MNRQKQTQWMLIRENGPMYLGAFFCVWMTVLFSYAMPLVFSETIDVLLTGGQSALPGWVLAPLRALGGRDFYRDRLWLAAIAVVGLSVFNGVFSYFMERDTAIAGEAIARTLRERLYRNLSYLTFDYHVKAETGDLIQRCTSDVETVRRYLSVQLKEMARAIVMAVVAFSILFGRDVELTLWSMVLFPVMAVFSAVFFSNTTKGFRLSDESEGRMSGVLQENLTGVRVVRAFGMQQKEVEKFDAASANFRDTTMSVIRMLCVFWSSMDGLTMLQIMITLLLAVTKAVRGEISLGTVVVFTSYISMLIYPLRQLGRILSDRSKCQVALGRIQEVLSQEAETAGGDLRPDLSGDIVFDHVSFRYGENEEWVLRDLSMTIPGGKTVALLGSTGSGKSTVVHLLQRLYEPTEGRITIGGTDLKRIDRWYLRERVGLLLQEPFLYGRSVRDNLAIVEPNAPAERVLEMSRAARADGFIRGFENGYDTLIGERGVTLSGGQRQRVAIARTLLKPNSVLVFDDSLSAVDMNTDRAIREELQNRQKGVTTVIISHRVSTLCEADQIFVLDKGRLADQGTHGELLHREGMYRDICAIQSELESDLERSRRAVGKEDA